MNHYQTLTGEIIDLGILRGSLQLFVHTMIAHTSRKQEMEDDADKLSANDFAAQVREHLRVQYPQPEAYSSVMRGPVGTIYRDCFYRLYAREYAREKLEKNEAQDESVLQKSEQAFIRNIRYNPARILLDRFLEDPATQVQFSRETGLDTATVSRVFSYVLTPESKEASLGLARLAEVCERLQVVPLAGYHSSTQWADPLAHQFLNTNSGGFTTRERQLRVIVAAVTRCLCFVEPNNNAELKTLRAFLGLHLAALYGVKDALALDRMTTAVFDDILALPRLEEIPEQAHKDKQDEAYDLEGDSLLNFLEEFSLAIGHKAGTVAFVTTEIKNVIEKNLDRSRQESSHRTSQNRQAKSRFEHLRNPIRDNWSHALKVFEQWYKSDAFREWMLDEEEMAVPQSGDDEPEIATQPKQDFGKLRTELHFNFASLKGIPAQVVNR